jgi:hypothetical protein
MGHPSAGRARPTRDRLRRLAGLLSFCSETRFQILTMRGSKECAVNGEGGQTDEMAGKDARIARVHGCDAVGVPSCVDIPVGDLSRAYDIAGNDGGEGDYPCDMRQFCCSEHARPTNSSQSEIDPTRLLRGTSCISGRFRTGRDHCVQTWATRNPGGPAEDPWLTSARSAGGSCADSEDCIPTRTGS